MLPASLKEGVLRSWNNLKGWSTSQKFVVLESDDWGAIRMPGKRAYEDLLRAGLPVDKSPFDMLDSLERRADIEALATLLDSHCDIHGSRPKISANMVLGNPDFQRIRESRFAQYHRESFLESYENQYGENLLPLWEECIEMGIMNPEFHASDHLNTEFWLSDLRAGYSDTRLAFDHGFYGLTTNTSIPGRKDYLAAYWPISVTNAQEIAQSMKAAMAQFADLFKRSPKSFTACNYIWPDEIERDVYSCGIELIQGQRGQLRVSADGKKLGRRSLATGQKAHYGAEYIVRNVYFEPFLNSHKDWVDSCLHQIRNAFRFNSPAVISTHRANYASYCRLANRDRNLRQLNLLLKGIKKHWPDVVFCSASDLKMLDARSH